MPRSIVQALVAGATFALACSPAATEDAHMSKQQHLTPSSKGYADAAEGLRVYYEIHGKGEPIVVMAGGLGDTSSMAQVDRPAVARTPGDRHRSRGTRPHGAAQDADEPRAKRR